MNKSTIHLSEKQLRHIISESIKNTLNEIGDTRSGQYMLGKLWRKKYDKNPDASGNERFKNAEPIRKYAQQNNKKSMDGVSAFERGQHAEMNAYFRQNELQRNGKTKRKSEEEIFNSLYNKDKSEKNMNPSDIQNYAYNWLINNYQRIMKYKGDRYTQDYMQRNGCKNLGELIDKLYEEKSVPGWTIYKKFFNEIYDELNLYHDGASYCDRNNGFNPAWEEFCEYVHNHS